MAAGKHLELIAQLFRWSANVLQMELAALGCTPAQINKIMVEFESARRHVWVTSVMKQSYVLTLPWLLLGIGHYELDIARRIARTCLLVCDEVSFCS